MKIEKLTEDQIAKVPEYVKKWTDIGLSTDPLDKEKVTIAVNKLYDCGGLEPPKIVIFLDSPLAGYYGVQALRAISQAASQVRSQVASQVYSQVYSQVASQVRSQVHSRVHSQVDSQVYSQVASQVRSQVRSQVDSRVRSQVYSQVRSQVDSQVDSQVASQVYSQVRSQVASQVYSQVASQVYSQVDSQVDSQVRSQVASQVYSQVASQVDSQVYSQFYNSLIYGHHDSGWLSFYDFFRGIGLKSETEKARGLFSLAKQAGWCFAFKELCIVTSKHSSLQLDAAGRLHSDAGMAVSYPDGWGVYAWHGIRVTERMIMHPNSFTSQEILDMKNSEQTRALAEIMGWNVFLEKMGTKKIDDWQDSRTGLSYELHDIAHKVGSLQPRFLKMQSPVLNDKSQPFYIEPVDPRLTSAKAARAWQLLDWDESDPDGLVEKCNANPEVTFLLET